MPITVESASAAAEKNTGSSAISTLMSIRKIQDVPKFVWVILGGVVLLLIIGRKGSKPGVLPPGQAGSEGMEF